MDTRRVLQVDAFADEPLSGNAAGVVPDAEGLTEEQMGAIASEMAVSETAFVLESDDADRRLRYFTPTQEVDLCGHATVATHAALFEEGVIDAGTHSLETNVGVLEIEIEADGTVWMTQDTPTVEPVDLDYDRVAAALGVDVAALEDIGADLPLAVATTGLPFLVVPVNFLSHLSGMDPDMGAIEDLCEAVDATGIYAFTFDAIDRESTLHGRCFVPLAGVPEDPVTGTASGAVAAYLRQNAAFNEDEPDELRFEQGHFVDRPGLVRVHHEGELRVGGGAVTALDGSIVVPEADEDEILEV